MQQPESGRGRARSRGLPAGRRWLYAAAVLVVFWGAAEVVARIADAAAPSERFGAMGDVLVAAGFEQLQTILEPDDARFWRVRSNLDAVSLEGRLGNAEPLAFSVSTDANGRRRMPAVADAGWDVVFLGDSCTFGVGVEGDETFAALLQRRIAGMRAVNAAAPGYTAYQGRVTYETQPFERTPRAVVISFLFNDDLPWDGRSDLEHAEDRAGALQGLASRSRLVSMLMGLRAHTPQDDSGAPSNRPRLDDAEYAAELRRIVARVRSQGGEAVLVAWPLARQMANDRVTRKQLVMRNLARQLDAPFVDLLPHFRARGRALYADAVHANVAGNRIVADQLEATLRRLLAP